VFLLLPPVFGTEAVNSCAVFADDELAMGATSGN
jgi:hypothetical protein